MTNDFNYLYPVRPGKLYQMQIGIYDCSSNFSMYMINSLAPGKFELNFRHVIFKQILVFDGWGISCENALWMSLDFTDD